MGAKITILDELPIILTKDFEWLRNNRLVAKSGAVIALPEDAVLVIAPKEVK